MLIPCAKSLRMVYEYFLAVGVAWVSGTTPRHWLLQRVSGRKPLRRRESLQPQLFAQLTLRCVLRPCPHLGVSIDGGAPKMAGLEWKIPFK